MSTEVESDDDAFERARKYIAKIDGAVSHHGGHDQTFKVACILAGGFGLDEDDAFELLAEYNKRCKPPWTEEELLHKIEDALMKVDEDKLGYLLEKKFIPTNPRDQFGPGTMDQIQALAKLRNMDLAGPVFATHFGLLKFGIWHEMECWALTDSSGKIFEIRRLDGQNFSANAEYGLGERKSHTLKGSKKSWPLGIADVGDVPNIALVEGGPDLLYACFRIYLEQREDVRPVAMMSASPLIDAEALPLFAGKVVRIYPHMDVAGLNGAEKWKKQLLGAGAKQVDMFDLSGLLRKDGEKVGDLCDLTMVAAEVLDQDGGFKNILP